MKIRKMAVAVGHHHGFKSFCHVHRCRLLSYTHFDHNIHELSHTTFAHSLKQAFEDANFHRSLSTPCLSLTTSVDEEFEFNPKIEIMGGYKAPRVRSLVVEVAMAIASGVDPMLLSNGLGGAYILRGQNGENIAVAKPIDEEAFAFNNPKGFGGRMLGQPGLKRSVRIGETGIREFAAYLLDHSGFAGVPPSALVKISNVTFHINNEGAISSTPFKIASLQRFVDHDYDAGELGPSGFSVASVHHIGILDVRILNLDRHAGNILVKKHEHDSYTAGVAELVPIDHGLCLPEWLDEPYFEWLHWPQASVPFSESELEYISNLDPFKDADLLRTEVPSLREACIRVLVLCTIFLKQAAAAGLCLARIGEMMSCEFCAGEEKPSVLENVCAQAKASIPIILDHNESRRTTEEIEIFQFDNGSEDTYQDEVSNVPQLLQSHRGIEINALSNFMYKENNQDDDLSEIKAFEDNNGSYDGSSDVDHKVAGLTRSKSSSLPHSHNHEASAISFADMNETNWELFLKNFEKLLPEVLDQTKGLSQKQRLGTSCSF